jgi:hypothetical protein
VFADVEQQLADGHVEDELQLPVENHSRRFSPHRHLQPVLLAEMLGQPLDGREQAKLVEDRRYDLECQIPGVIDGLVQEAADLLQRTG